MKKNIYIFSRVLIVIVMLFSFISFSNVAFGSITFIPSNNSDGFPVTNTTPAPPTQATLQDYSNTMGSPIDQTNGLSMQKYNVNSPDTSNLNTTNTNTPYFNHLSSGAGAQTNSVESGGSSNGQCSVSSGLSQPNFKCVVSFATSAINQIIYLLIGIAIIVFIFGLIKYIAAGGEEKTVEEAKKFIVFGIIALFVIVSVWGLVNLLTHTFFPSGTGLFIPQIK